MLHENEALPHIIDNDLAKEEIPEYEGGRYASLVHEEADQITLRWARRAFARGDNVAIAIVGRTPSRMRFCRRPLAPSRHTLSAEHFPQKDYGIILKEEGFDEERRYSRHTPYGQRPKLVEASGGSGAPLEGRAEDRLRPSGDVAGMVPPAGEDVRRPGSAGLQIPIHPEEGIEPEEGQTPGAESQRSFAARPEREPRPDVPRFATRPEDLAAIPSASAAFRELRRPSNILPETC